jgi:hypothetical protein
MPDSAQAGREKPVRLYDVTIRWPGERETISPVSARTPGAAKMAVYYRGEFSCSVRDFLRRTSVRLRREPLPDDGYTYVARYYGFDFRVGDRVEIRNCGSLDGQQGTVTYPGGSAARVFVMLDGKNHDVPVHPSDVVRLAKAPPHPTTLPPELAEADEIPF